MSGEIEHYALLQFQATNNPKNSRNLKIKRSNEFTYRHFLGHLKVYRDKLALMIRRWKCKKANYGLLPLNRYENSSQRFRPPWAGQMGNSARSCPVQFDCRIYRIPPSRELRKNKRTLFFKCIFWISGLFGLFCSLYYSKSSVERLFNDT